MGTVKFWSGMTKASTVKGVDKMMLGENDTGEALYVDFDQVKQYLDITSNDLPPIEGGDTEATALVVPAGPFGQTRRADVVSGKWYNFGTGAVQATSDRLWKAYWDGSAWFLIDMGELPSVDTTNLVTTPDLNLESSGLNKFNYLAVEDGYIDPSTGVDSPNAGGTVYKRSHPINLTGNSVGKIAVSGLGNVHWSLGWNIKDGDGNVILSGATSPNVGSAIINYTSVQSTAKTFKITLKTNASGDNTVLSGVQIEFGDAVTSFQPYSTFLVGINNAPVKAKDIDGKSYAADKNKFDPTAILDGYIDLVTGAYRPGATLKRTSKISLSGNSTGLLSISGLGNIHYGLGWRINDNTGNILLRGQTSQDVVSATINYSSVLENAHSFEMTVVTNKAGDNTNVNNIQIEFGGVKTSFEAYKSYLSKLLDKELIAFKAKKADSPVADDDIVTLGYFKSNSNGAKLTGKNVLVLGDSITQDANSWVRQAIPLMGGILLNLAVSGARAGDLSGTAINLSPTPGTNSPDNVLSNQVRRAAQATFALGAEITWTHPVTGEVFGVPTSIGTGTATFGTPDLIIIAIGTNDTVYSGDFSTVKDLPLSSLPNTQLTGGLRWAVENLMILYPNAQILISTPIQSQPGGTRPFDVTKTKRQRIVEVAEYYSITLIDAFYESGISEKFEVAGNGRYLADGLHPNNNGKAKMRDFLINELNKKYVARR